MRYLKIMLATLGALALWSAIPVAGAIYGWWREPIAPPGDAAAFMTRLASRLDAARPGNAAVVLIEDGALFDEHFRSIGAAVDRDTVFPLASLGKWVSAWAVMTLVEEGRLDLDRPVNDYLSRWQIPDAEFDSRGVTARRLLSHTAGLTDDLGFADYEAGERVPSLEQSLAAPRASSGEPVRIAPGAEPGGEWRYSGGGYLVLELLVEEVSGVPFADYVERAVFAPLGMSRATYRHPAELDNAAQSFTPEGRPAPLYRYASKAATGLAASAGDLTRFALAQLPGASTGPLEPGTLQGMREPHGYALGQAIWGLGPILYAPTDGDYVFGHDGGNEPAINATVRVNPDTRDAIVMLVTGHSSLASSVAGDWVFWQTGTPDFFSVGADVQRVVPAVLIGWALILVAAIVITFRLRRRPA